MILHTIGNAIQFCRRRNWRETTLNQIINIQYSEQQWAQVMVANSSQSRSHKGRLSTYLLYFGCANLYRLLSLNSRFLADRCYKMCCLRTLKVIHTSVGGRW